MEREGILVIIFVLMLLLVNLVPQCLAAERFEPSWESLKEHEYPEWFRDAKFGCWSGEFVRGPKVQWGSPWNGGRSHYGKCFSAVVAGGGFRGGHVVGASNEKDMEVADRPVYPEDLIGSMYALLGIDQDGPVPNPRGLDVKVMPASDKGAGRLTEIV